MKIVADILTRMLVSVSVSTSWNASLYNAMQRVAQIRLRQLTLVKLAFHDADTDTAINTDIDFLARKSRVSDVSSESESVSASWNASSSDHAGELYTLTRDGCHCIYTLTSLF